MTFRRKLALGVAVAVLAAAAALTVRAATGGLPDGVLAQVDVGGGRIEQLTAAQLDRYTWTRVRSDDGPSTLAECRADSDCRDVLDQARAQTQVEAVALLRAQAELARRGGKVTDADRKFARQLTGGADRTLNERFASVMALNRIQDADVAKKVPAATAEQARRYVKEHAEQFNQPASALAAIYSTPSRKAADRFERLMRRRAPGVAAAVNFLNRNRKSDKQNGGMTTITAGDGHPLEREILATDSDKLNRTVGPLRRDGRLWFYEVTFVDAGKRTSARDAERQAQRLLTDQRRQRERDRWTAAVDQRWQKKLTCADDIKESVCAP